MTVTDASHNTATAGVTLREPSALSISVTSTAYSNGYDVSCYQCFNGSISTTPSGGVGSYTYLWNSGATTQNRSSIGGGTYTVTVTDANSCSKGGSILVTEAPRDEWAMDGNSGSNPSTQYIGTADSTDLVFKTNANERLRIAANGDVKIKALESSGYQLAYVGPLGNFTTGPPATPVCPNGRPWLVCGNIGTDPDINFVGTTDSVSLTFRTHDNEAMRILPTGKIGIGISTVPTGYLLAVKGKLIAEEVKVKLHTAWPDYVFEKGYPSMPLNELENYIKTNKHLPDIPSAEEIKTGEGFEI